MAGNDVDDVDERAKRNRFGKRKRCLVGKRAKELGVKGRWSKREDSSGFMVEDTVHSANNVKQEPLGPISLISWTTLALVESAGAFQSLQSKSEILEGESEENKSSLVVPHVPIHARRTERVDEWSGGNKGQGKTHDRDALLNLMLTLSYYRNLCLLGEDGQGSISNTQGSFVSVTLFLIRTKTTYRERVIYTLTLLISSFLY